MYNKELAPEIVKSAQGLAETYSLVHSDNRVSSISPEVINKYREAGIDYASFCIVVYRNPQVAAACFQYAGQKGTQDVELAFHQHVPGDLSAGSTSIRMVRLDNGQIDLQYIVTRRSYRSLDKNFQEFLHQDSPDADPESWSVSSIGNITEQGYENLVASRDCSPSDIIHDRLLPGFVWRTIEICGKIKYGLETDALQQMGILHRSQEQLLQLTAAFQEASRRLDNALSPDPDTQK